VGALLPLRSGLLNCLRSEGETQVGRLAVCGQNQYCVLLCLLVPSSRKYLRMPRPAVGADMSLSTDAAKVMSGHVHAGGTEAASQKVEQKFDLKVKGCYSDSRSGGAAVLVLSARHRCKVRWLPQEIEDHYRRQGQRVIWLLVSDSLAIRQLARLRYHEKVVTNLDTVAVAHVGDRRMGPEEKRTNFISAVGK
jgi:hypothetical protein